MTVPHTSFRRWPGRGRPVSRAREPERGTPELVRHRMNQVSGQQEKTTYSTSILGILYAHGIISKASYEVGEWYLEDARQAFRCLQAPLLKQSSRASEILGILPQKQRCLPQGHVTWSGAYEKAVLYRWQRLSDVLNHAGEGVKTAVDHIVLYDRGVSPQSKTFRFFEKGLAALTDFYEGRRLGNPAQEKKR